MRDFDVVVLGATGLTGRRVAAHLADHAENDGLRWAAAGRDARRVIDTLAANGVGAAEVVVADTSDSASVVALAGRARVLLNLAGPYLRHAPAVVEACLAAGCHYVDLAGEMPLSYRLLRRHDAAARAAGLALVTACGFESMPADLAVAALAEHARAGSGRLSAVEVRVDIVSSPRTPRLSDVSGGTLQSLVLPLGDDDARVIPDPAALIEDAEDAARVRARSPIRIAPRIAGGVVAPMTPGPFVNPAVIQRSAAARAAARQEPFVPFVYREGTALPGSRATFPLRIVTAGLLAAPQAFIRAVALVPFPRARRSIARLVSAALPGSGHGFDDQERAEEWQWTMSVRAEVDSGKVLELDVVGDGHLGWVTSARAVAEAGLALAAHGRRAPGGYLTPAMALGVDDLPRYARAGMRFGPVRDG